MPNLIVSDHAVIRYLERRGGFNLESLRQQISERLQAAADVVQLDVAYDGVIYEGDLPPIE